MAFVQHTRCEPASGHSTMNQYIQASLEAGVFGVLTGLVVAASGHPLCGFIAAELTAFMWLAAYCQWWLYHRLVCVGGALASDPAGDRNAVGVVITIEPPEEKSGFDAIDTDYSINLLVANAEPTDDRPTIEATTPYGHLVAEQSVTRDEGLPFTSYTATDEPTGSSPVVLHAEFEGAGVYDVSIANGIALGLSAVALIACLADGFWGTLAAIVLAILALLAALIGLLVGLGDTGSPSDVGVGTITSTKDKADGASIMGVFGTWVYDSGHNNEGKGYNEIHTIKRAAQVGTWGGAWPPNTQAIIDDWEREAGTAGSALTVEEQGKPENDWAVHPLVDGCEPRETGETGVPGVPSGHDPLH